MPATSEHDYVLGTNDAEIERLPFGCMSIFEALIRRMYEAAHRQSVDDRTLFRKSQTETQQCNRQR